VIAIRKQAAEDTDTEQVTAKEKCNGPYITDGRRYDRHITGDENFIKFAAGYSCL